MLIRLLLRAVMLTAAFLVGSTLADRPAGAEEIPLRTALHFPLSAPL